MSQLNQDILYKEDVQLYTVLVAYDELVDVVLANVDSERGLGERVGEQLLDLVDRVLLEQNLDHQAEDREVESERGEALGVEPLDVLLWAEQQLVAVGGQTRTARVRTAHRIQLLARRVAARETRERRRAPDRRERWRRGPTASLVQPACAQYSCECLLRSTINKAVPVQYDLV